MRTIRLLDSSLLDIDSEVGDHHPGAAVTCGKIVFCSSADDCFYSDLILNWGGNPTYTQIPNAHFINEARYHGARVVSITPDLNASGIHTDLWVPVNVGSDAALGLSLAQVILEEELHDAAFIREQTDLPLLVRRDTRRFLRASDLEEGGKKTSSTSSTSLPTARAPCKGDPRDRGARAGPGGDFQLATRQGPVTVTPVLSLLREHLKSYTPELAAKITGTSPELIRSLARQIAKARARDDPDAVQLRQVLPRDGDGARAVPGARPLRPIRQEGKRAQRLPLPLDRRQHARGPRPAAAARSRRGSSAP